MQIPNDCFFPTAYDSAGWPFQRDFPRSGVGRPWAEAKIDGDSVLVWSDKVPRPVAVRYAWADNPSGNLYNGAGLPAPPFRTDDFPLTTKSAHF